MDQQQKQHDEDRDRTRDETGGVSGSREPSDELRAEGRRLMDAADASLARAESIDRILDDQLSLNSSQFLTTINQGSGQ